MSSQVLYAKDGFEGRLRRILVHMPLCDMIEDFWIVPANQRTPAWVEHRDINEVMLATSLLPDGYLGRE